MSFSNAPSTYSLTTSSGIAFELQNVGTAPVYVASISAALVNIAATAATDALYYAPPGASAAATPYPTPGAQGPWLLAGSVSAGTGSAVFSLPNLKLNPTQFLQLYLVQTAGPQVRRGLLPPSRGRTVRGQSADSAPSRAGGQHHALQPGDRERL